MTMKPTILIFINLVLLAWLGCLQWQMIKLKIPDELRLKQLTIVDDQNKPKIILNGELGQTFIDGRGIHLLNTVGETSINGGGVWLEKPDHSKTLCLFSDMLCFSVSKAGGTSNDQINLVALGDKNDFGALYVSDDNDKTTSTLVLPGTSWSYSSLNNKNIWELPGKGTDDYIDVNSKNYSVVKSDVGTFLVSCQGAEPYLEGYKLHLHIGNPTAMTVNNPTINIEWGREMPKWDSSTKDYSKICNDWKQSLKTTSITLTDPLKPGAWNAVDVILAPAKAEDLEHLVITLKTDDVSLAPPQAHP